VFFLGLGEFGLLSAELSLGLGDLHAFAGAGAGADEVGLEFGDHGQDVEEEFADGVGGVVDGSAEAELDVPLGEVLDDVACVGQRAGEPVQLGDHQGVADPAGGEGLLESGALAVSSGEAVVDVDQVVRDSERLEAGLLGAEVLLVGGDSGVTRPGAVTCLECSVCVACTGQFLGRGNRESGSLEFSTYLCHFHLMATALGVQSPLH
jgi:hypothetical protein